MRITAEIHYPAPSEDVARMLATEEYLRQRITLGGATVDQVNVVGTPEEGFTATTRGQLPSDAIPANMRSFVGNTLEIRQVEVWEAPGEDGSRRATVVIEIAGAPVRLTGTRHIRPNEEGTCSDAVEGQLKASVPLLGPSIEKAAAPAVYAALDAEHKAAQRWLTDQE